MLRQCLSLLSGIALLGSLGAIFTSPSYAKPAREFFCDNQNAFPKTRVKNNTTGDTRTLIVWSRNTFADIGYDNLTRCNIVSQKFQEAYNFNRLQYLTAGRVNNYSVICATVANGSCNQDNILFTVRPGGDAAVTLQQLFNRRDYASAYILNETSSRSYIDMEAVISSLKVEEVDEEADVQPAVTPGSVSQPTGEVQQGSSSQPTGEFTNPNIAF